MRAISVIVGWLAIVAVVLLPACDVWQKTHSQVWLIITLLATAVALAVINALVEWLLESLPDPPVWRGRPIPWDASEYVPGALVDELLDGGRLLVVIFVALAAVPFGLFLWPLQDLPLLGLDAWFARIAPERAVLLGHLTATGGWATVASIAFWNAFKNLREVLLDVLNKAWRLTHPRGGSIR